VNTEIVHLLLQYFIVCRFLSTVFGQDMLDAVRLSWY